MIGAAGCGSAGAERSASEHCKVDRRSLDAVGHITAAIIRRQAFARQGRCGKDPRGSQGAWKRTPPATAMAMVVLGDGESVLRFLDVPRMMSSEDEGLILHPSSWIETSASVDARPTPAATLVVQCWGLKRAPRSIPEDGCRTSTPRPSPSILALPRERPLCPPDPSAPLPLPHADRTHAPVATRHSAQNPHRALLFRAHSEIRTLSPDAAPRLSSPRFASACVSASSLVVPPTAPSPSFEPDPHPQTERHRTRPDIGPRGSRRTSTSNGRTRLVIASQSGNASSRAPPSRRVSDRGLSEHELAAGAGPLHTGASTPSLTAPVNVSDAPHGIVCRLDSRTAPVPPYVRISNLPATDALHVSTRSCSSVRPGGLTQKKLRSRSPRTLRPPTHLDVHLPSATRHPLRASPCSLRASHFFFCARTPAPCVNTPVLLAPPPSRSASVPPRSTAAGSHESRKSRMTRSARPSQACMLRCRRHSNAHRPSWHSHGALTKNHTEPANNAVPAALERRSGRTSPLKAPHGLEKKTPQNPRTTHSYCTAPLSRSSLSLWAHAVSSVTAHAPPGALPSPEPPSPLPRARNRNRTPVPARMPARRRDMSSRRRPRPQGDPHIHTASAAITVPPTPDSSPAAGPPVAHETPRRRSPFEADARMTSPRTDPLAKPDSPPATRARANHTHRAQRRAQDVYMGYSGESAGELVDSTAPPSTRTGLEAPPLGAREARDDEHDAAAALAISVSHLAQPRAQSKHVALARPQYTPKKAKCQMPGAARGGRATSEVPKCARNETRIEKRKKNDQRPSVHRNAHRHP
ncbi:hypothetical protein HETIRDRAFT_461432 [Heterobasidion irregulare TC 32-1]|uniref:Uncharacterized protein n=1 Tax=Heterobasidion irregulare (strain TC 32-1) TaxID=747525 RepID=W4JPC4_HETIT|nr:uncharacterized protein HETIRDRAFT_461432 [Heterobasidion irregulare TC 32-1]ETW74736.1 hypothetical protein HETIRDRAFT_461432 [Heterobasidion irregulare TC 32-1]